MSKFFFFKKQDKFTDEIRFQSLSIYTIVFQKTQFLKIKDNNSLSPPWLKKNRTVLLMLQVLIEIEMNNIIFLDDILPENFLDKVLQILLQKLSNECKIHYDHQEMELFLFLMLSQ